MTVTLTYDDTNSRVQITANALAGADTATIERSIDQVVWTTVRGALAVPLTGGSMTLPGTSGNYASTPDNAALDVLGDLDLRADVTMTDWTPATTATLVSKWGAAGQRSYMLQVGTTGVLSLSWSNDGTTINNAVSTVSPTVVDGQRLAVRAVLDVDNGAAGRTITFYTAPTIDGPWVQLGTPVVQGTTTSIFNSTAPGEVGSNNGGTTELLVGTVHSVEIRNGIDGTLVAQPFFKGQPSGTTTFTDGPGRVWTLNGTASISTRQFAATFNDYEFTPCVQNFYRVRGVEAGVIGFIGVGAAATANNANVVPALPVGLLAGDLMVAFASIRNSGVGVVNVPAGWSVIRAFGNASLLGRRFVVGDTAPTITFNGGVVNADTIGQIAAWRRPNLAPTTGADVLTSVAAQNIPFPALASGAISFAGSLIIAAGWKQDDWTSVATVTNYTEIGEPFATAGDDAGEVWDYRILGAVTGIAADSFVVTGGATAISRGATVALPHAPFLNEQTANVTPAMTKVWFKSVTRPFLNIGIPVGCGPGGMGVMGTNPIEMLEPGTSVSRPARTGVFPIINRTFGVAVNDIRTGRQWTVSLRTFTVNALKSVDFLLASGDVILIQVPSGCIGCADSIEAGYVTAADASYTRHHRRRLRAVWEIAVQEVAPPGPDIVYAESTWQTVINRYGSWTATLAANASWTALIAQLPNPSEVIVP